MNREGARLAPSALKSASDQIAVVGHKIKIRNTTQTVAGKEKARIAVRA